MRSAPIEPARIVFDADAPPHAPAYGDVYHARAGALAQARHVFLAGNGLPQRWQRRTRFVILETGFGLGNNFLATWAAWRDDAQRCERLWYVAIDKHPPTRADLARAHRGSTLATLADALVAAWPPATFNLHTLAFDSGRLMLRLALGDIAAWLPQLMLDADAFYLDGFAPARNPAMWDPRLLKQLGGRAAPGATAATWSVARALRDGLTSAGFEVQRAPGLAGKREMTVARYAPAYTPRRARAPGRQAAPAAVIVGAGLAGAAAACALAANGWHCTVFERQPQPAAGASGNIAGLFHGSVAADDGPHARALRAAALEATRVYRPLLDAGVLPGAACGLLQLAGDAAPDALQQRLDRHGLPPDYVQPCDRPTASMRAGVELRGAAWWFPGGGWLSPAAWVTQRLADDRIEFRGATAVAALRREGGQWALLDAAGRTLARSATVVLAAADDVPRLLGQPPWPLARGRGQVTLLPAGLHGLPRPRVPLAGDGYAIALPDGRLLCGATRHAGDDDPTLRADDHRYNLQRLQRLCGPLPPGIERSGLGGRVGWRLAAADRLPVVGAVPLADASADRASSTPRIDGLFVCTAFGSRGITWAPLAGALLAAWAAGDPFPLEAQLVDALDPARFALRALRRPAR